MKYEFCGISFLVKSPYKVMLEKKEADNGLLKIGISIDFGDACVPEEVKIVWDIPAVGIMSAWNPSLDCSPCLMPDWWAVEAKSRAIYGAPVQAHIGMMGENKCTVALSDAITPCLIKSGIYEETASVRYKLYLFTKLSDTMESYSAELLIDRRSIPFYDAVVDVANWWKELGYTEALVPPVAKMPMYSTWYAMHQNLSSKELISELCEAKRYGMDSVIVDDGWQTEDNQRGYSFCGDWEIAKGKIHDMKELVSDIHKTGMKLLLWYNVPYIGKNSKAYAKFDGMFLYCEPGKWGVLDPRYKEARDYITDIYEKAVLAWDIDGLKLDFIDSFELRENSEYKTGMDICSLEDAVCTLLSDIKARLTAIKSDIMIEYRQNYMGPAMRMTANMMRAADSPLDAVRNRVYCLGLKMISGSCAVHSDMLMWNMADTAEDAALQIINVIFAVPQVSVLLKNLSDSHKKMLKFYLNFWRENQKCLTEGKLRLYNPEANYSMATTETESEIIATFYSRNILETDKKFKKIVLINGSGTDVAIINNKSDEQNFILRIYRCTGECCTETEYILNRGINIFTLSAAGVLELIEK